MNFIVRFLYFLLLLFIIRKIVYWILGKNQPVRSADRPGEPTRITGQVMRDPECGTYIDTRLALVERFGGQNYYFCSERCRRLFVESSQPETASR